MSDQGSTHAADTSVMPWYYWILPHPIDDIVLARFSVQRHGVVGAVVRYLVFAAIVLALVFVVGSALGYGPTRIAHELATPTSTQPGYDPAGPVPPAPLGAPATP